MSKNDNIKRKCQMKNEEDNSEERNNINLDDILKNESITKIKNSKTNLLIF